MRTSQFLLNTTKETPADAQVVSHQLMIRAGLIRKLASGLYTWMPLGIRILEKVKSIIRQEMNNIGAMEMLMPAVQPAELWEESGRWEQYGPELLRIKDRHDRDFCFGPTHEEVVTDIARNVLRSYKQLPTTLYQIQTKFRDEIRPRFGVMRAREFVMKDAYSFHADDASLQQTYQDMHSAYCTIFKRLGLTFRPVMADSGSIGGSTSHEFQILAETGEDKIAYCDESDYAANVELASAQPGEKSDEALLAMETLDTPGLYTIDELCKEKNIDIKKTVKTLFVMSNDDTLIALIVRGDHTLNPIKAEKIDNVASPLQMASDELIEKTVGAKPGSLGPVNLDVPMVIDRDVAVMTNFSAGANKNGEHYININWDRDVDLPTVADLRFVEEGDISPDGKGPLKFTRGIEAGHIFQLGTKYSEPLNAVILDENGKSKVMTMGCYGMGVTRIVAAAIEQNHDKHGIIWPKAMAPFAVVITPVQMQKSFRVKEAAEKLYEDLTAAGIDVLLDDRKERPGVMFADMDLIGIPVRIVIGERGLDKGMVEYKARNEENAQDIPLSDILNKVTSNQ